MFKVFRLHTYKHKCYTRYFLSVMPSTCCVHVAILPSRQPIDVDIISMSVLFRNKVGPTMSTNQPIFEFVSTEYRRPGINFVQSTSNRCLNYILGVMHSKTKSKGQDNSLESMQNKRHFFQVVFSPYNLKRFDIHQYEACGGSLFYTH